MKDTTLLSVKNLNKIYPSGVHALRDVSFEVRAGEFWSSLG